MTFRGGVEVRGGPRAERMFRVAATIPDGIGHDELGEHVRLDADHIRAKPYVPELPGQAYVRTYKMKSHIKTQSPKRGHWEIRDFEDYAVWVIKEGWQNTKYHLGRWWTVDDVVEARLDRLADKTADAVDAEWRRQ